MRYWVRREIERERMKTRSSDAEGDSRGKMIAPVGEGNGGRKRKLVQSNEQKNDIQREEDGRAKRRIVQSSDQKNGKILRGIRGCVSPRCSAQTYQSRFSWYFLLPYERNRSILRYYLCVWVWVELEFDFEMFVRRLILLYWMDLGDRVRSIIFGTFWNQFDLYEIQMLISISDRDCVVAETWDLSFSSYYSAFNRQKLNPDSNEEEFWKSHRYITFLRSKSLYQRIL